ncbi:MAG: hypothetical protein ACPGVG_09105, partial [Mycobacterium sp.]
MKRIQFARRRRRRAISLASAPLVAATLLSGCGSHSGPPTLTWYVFPDNGGAVARAQECAEASGGAYRVRTELLPSGATAQREQMVRRLAAHDSSIDIVSVDVVFTAEFANAGFLRPFTSAETTRLTADMLPAPVATGMWGDKLYAARIPIFPRRVSGFFRSLKWWLMGMMLGIYYITPWIRWDR